MRILLTSLVVLVTFLSPFQNVVHASDKFSELRCVGNRGFYGEFLFKLNSDMYWMLSNQVKIASVQFSGKASSKNVVVKGTVLNPAAEANTLTYTFTTSNKITSTPSKGTLEIKYDMKSGYRKEPATTYPLICCFNSYPILGSVGLTYCETDQSKSQASLLGELRNQYGDTMRTKAIEEIKRF